MTSDSVEAVAPGTSAVYGAFMFCLSDATGAIMYARNGRVLLSYRDTAPLAVRFYGLATSGVDSATTTVANIRSVPLSSLKCPVLRGKTCNGHGTCDAMRRCVCEPGWMGFRCQFDCPATANGVCNGKGEPFGIRD